MLIPLTKGKAYYLILKTFGLLYTEPATCEANLHVRFYDEECREWLFRRPAFSTLLGMALI